MSDDISSPVPTPTNYERTTGGHLCWQPPTPEHLQEMLPAYEVLSILGQGGMGAVYKGRQISLDRFVAIKILPPEAAEDDMQFAERFKNEARTMAKMNHPAIVQVYDFGQTAEGQLYIVMEYIDGTDVAKMIKSQGKLPEDYALSITAHVCDALGYAHTQGVVHRDIKPANVLINLEGQVKVADFGLAKATDPNQMGLTKTNMAMGTPDFVSPEAMMPGVTMDGRADLYAVGVMLYNMLTGKIPRGAFSMPSATLQTDSRFDRIIGKAMQMDREERYQTALDLRRDLDAILSTPIAKIVAQPALPQKPMGQRPSAPQQRRPGRPSGVKLAASQVPAKKSNAGMIFGIAAAVAVIAGGAFIFSGGKKAPSPTPKEVAEAKPEPKKPDTKTSKPASAPKPTPPSPDVTVGKENWVDGLAQWFGGTKTNEAFVREGNGGTRIGNSSATLKPLRQSSPQFRDQVVRMRWHAANSRGEVRLFARSAKDASGKERNYSAAVKASKTGGWEVRLTGPSGVLGNRDWALPADFNIEANHTMEFRVIGEWLTASIDGKKIAEARDSRITDGHPYFSGHDVIIESFEYANLDPGSESPAPASSPKPSEVLSFGGHRYQLVMEPLSWAEAKAKAEAMGGHLATITSLEENEWIFRHIKAGKERYFIGAIQRAKAPWQWVTGEPLSLQPWMKTFPNDKDGTEHVGTLLSDKKWDDVGINYKSLPFLVEWEGDTPAPASAVASAAPATSSPPPSVATMPAVASEPAPTPPAPPQDPRLAQLEAGFKARYETDAQQPFAAALEALKKSYVGNGVSRARAAAQAKGSLTEITALDAEKAAIEKGAGVPDEDEAETPESLKALRVTYRSALGKISAERDARAAPLYDLYLKALDGYIAELTKSGKNTEARRTQVFRDGIALEKPGAEAAVVSAEVNASPATEPGSAAKEGVRAPRMTEREVAEWAIATGGSVDLLIGSPAVRKKFDSVAELPRARFTITSLVIKCDKVPDRDLSPLASAVEAGSLMLENSLLSDKTSLGLAPVRQMPKLRSLHTRDLDAAAVDVICSLAKLESLYLGNIPAESLGKMGRLKELEALECSAISGPGIAALKNCKKLRSIANHGNPCLASDEDVRALATALPQLETLSIGSGRNSAAQVTNACLPTILTFKSLKSLGLNGRDVDDAALETIAKMRSLDTVGLEGTKVTGATFTELTKLPALKNLWIRNSAITDAALDEVAKLKGLKAVNFTETGVSDAAVAKLKAALPDCKVTK